MDKGRLYHRWTKVRRFQPVYFVILFVISALICVFALRGNNLTMVQLRSNVYAADKSGQGVEAALQKLQLYVTHHMNTNLAGGPGSVKPPIQLKYTYERAQQASVQQLNDSNFYTEAQDYCQQKYPVESSLYVWQSYVSCVENYLKSRNLNIKVTSGPPVALYEFDFISPAWSPDLAGWSLLASALFLVLAVASFLIDFWFKRQLKSKN